MSRINVIQNEILQLDGGSFQKLFDAYLLKKYNFKNIQPLGVHSGTNKTTKGTPDSFVKSDNGNYTLIMYGTVETAPFSKLEKDLLSCFNKDKLELPEEKIEKLICAYTSTNIHIEQIDALEKLIDGITIEMIGLGTISHDLLVNYPFLASKYLNIPIDTEQIFTHDEFVKKYDQNRINASLDMNLLHREQELSELNEYITNNKLTLVTGNSGIGKTRIVLEICKRYETKGWTVLCVKNNGELLYNDIRYYFSDKGNYLLFIDDANQTTSLEYVLNFIIDPPMYINIKTILTVRDYAKDRVLASVQKFTLPGQIQIKPLKKQEIKDVLTNNLKIRNDIYLDKIVDISNGNIRLAILAGRMLIDKGHIGIKNATDIFKNYYGEVLHSQKLDTTSINALFVIALLGPLRIRENEFALQILNIVDINEILFLNICHDLNERELVDLFQDQIVKLSDQSLGNYLLEYILIEKKNVSICQLLEYGFPKFKNKLVYALNTLINMFDSDEIMNYIESQVNKSWDSAQPEIQIDYLKTFYSINKEKSLLLIKKSIDQMKSINEDLTNFDFEKKKNYNSINSYEIEILCNYKYTEYYKDALQLLICFYNKRPDLVMQFYFAFSDRLSYDRYSHRLDYEKEYELIQCIWEHAEHGNNINCTLLMVHVLEKFLYCEFKKTESGENSRTINIISFSIVFSAGIKKIRKLIWSILAELYRLDLYRTLIEKVLSTAHVIGLEKEESKKIATFDMECIKELFVDKWDKLTFEQSMVLNGIEKNVNWLGINCAEIFGNKAINRDFSLYKNLIIEQIIGKTWQEKESERRETLIKMVEELNDDDYRNMFRMLVNCEEKNDRNNYSLATGINIVFSILKTNFNKYLEVVKIYLQCGAPYGYTTIRIVKNITQNIGSKETEVLIKNNDFKYKRNWLCELWETIPEAEINEYYAKELLDFIEQELNFDRPLLPNVVNIEKYKRTDPEIITKVSNLVINTGEKGPAIVEYFLNTANEKDIEKILNIFNDEMELLEELYLLSQGMIFDYEGILLEKIITRNPMFWDKLTLKLAGNIGTSSYAYNIFEKIWAHENYKELIEIAYENMIAIKYGFMVLDEAVAVFANETDTAEEIKLRKTTWIKDYIHDNFLDNKKISMIFGVIATIFTSERIEYIVELLKHSRDIEVFKIISLFPFSSSWSGSEVPLIENKIVFLDELISEIKGFEYIEHRAYLKELKINYEKSKQSVLLTEYLENVDVI